MTPQVFGLLGGVFVSVGVFSASAAGASERRPADFHVAVDGSDTHAGSAAAPFATLARAQVAVREVIRAGLTRDVVVEVHGGWYPRQLFVGGRRAIRARTPNEGWCEGKPLQPIEYDATDQPLSIRINTAGGRGIFGWAREFEYDQATIPGGLPACGSPGDVELVSLRHNEGGRKRLEAIDAASATVTLRPPHRWAPKCYGNDWFNGVPDGRCFLENAAEFLDAPGEWYLDRGTGVFSYRPREGEDPATCDIVAPWVEGTGRGESRPPCRRRCSTAGRGGSCGWARSRRLRRGSFSKR